MFVCFIAITTNLDSKRSDAFFVFNKWYVIYLFIVYLTSPLCTVIILLQFTVLRMVSDRKLDLVGTLVNN